MHAVMHFFIHVCCVISIKYEYEHDYHAKVAILSTGYIHEFTLPADE